MKKFIRLNETYSGVQGTGLGDGSIIAANDIDFVQSDGGGRFITRVYYTSGKYIQIRHGNDYGDVVLTVNSAAANTAPGLIVGADGQFGPTSGVEVGQYVFNVTRQAYSVITAIGDNGSGTNNALTVVPDITGQAATDQIKIVLPGTQLKVVKALQEAIPKIASKNWRDVIATVNIGQPVTRVTGVF